MQTIELKHPLKPLSIATVYVESIPTLFNSTVFSMVYPLNDTLATLLQNIMIANKQMHLQFSIAMLVFQCEKIGWIPTAKHNKALRAENASRTITNT